MGLLYLGSVFSWPENNLTNPNFLAAPPANNNKKRTTALARYSRHVHRLSKLATKRPVGGVCVEGGGGGGEGGSSQLDETRRGNWGLAKTFRGVGGPIDEKHMAHALLLAHN